MCLKSFLEHRGVEGINDECMHGPAVSQQMKTGYAGTALPSSGPSSPPSLPCTWRGAGVRSWGSGAGLRCGGKGIPKRLRGRQGLQVEDPQRDLQFPEVFRKEEGMGSSESSGFLWLHILVKPAAEYRTAFSSGPTLFLSSDLMKVKVPPFYPPAHPHIFPWGQWTRGCGLCSLVTVGKWQGTDAAPLEAGRFQARCLPSQPLLPQQ